MTFPVHRPRRLRRSEALRGFVRETRLSPAGFVYPMFACPGKNVRTEVSSMPGIFQQSADQIAEECREVADLGIPAVILFGLPEHKDETGSESAAAQGAVQRSIEAIRKAKLDLLVITDVCLCEYTSHGHCGVIKDGEVLNDPTLEILAAAALSHARAGADIVAPSDMMDGRVAAIRRKLDENNFPDVAILSYAAKYCSSFYGPFREAGAIRAAIWRPPQLPDGSRECARSSPRSRSSISKKVRTSSWSSPRCRILTSSSASASVSMFPSRPTTSAANIRW